jgi:hypothetical protein
MTQPAVKRFLSLAGLDRVALIFGDLWWIYGQRWLAWLSRPKRSWACSPRSWSAAAWQRPPGSAGDRRLEGWGWLGAPAPQAECRHSNREDQNDPVQRADRP